MRPLIEKKSSEFVFLSEVTDTNYISVFSANGDF